MEKVKKRNKAERESILRDSEKVDYRINKTASHAPQFKYMVRQFGFIQIGSEWGWLAIEQKWFETKGEAKAFIERRTKEYKKIKGA